MSSAVLGASHTPLLNAGAATDETRAAVRAAFHSLANSVREFDPEVIVQFSPDHFNGFFYDLMPAFCIGTAAHSIGDWGTAPGPLPVAGDLARELATAVLADDIDVALSCRMCVDHGFVQIWEALFNRTDSYPLIPIFVNAIAPPIPSYRRARMLGEAVGCFMASTGRRVLFAASGGLSHDPPVPDLASASDDVRATLIDGRNPTPQMRQAREQRVRAAGEAASRREGPCLPLNTAWDHQVIDLLLRGDIAAFDAFSTEAVKALAGRGANETLAWIAAFAAMRATGPYRARCEFYEAIPGWIAGMAMMFGRATPNSEADR
jgi:2,3-dihydroxyphenylpropionate 1,2-dioxygenase